MKKALYILSFLFAALAGVVAQGQLREGGGGDFSLASQAKSQQSDSISVDSLLKIGKRITVYRLTNQLGTPYEVDRDTSLFNTAQKTFMENHGLSVAYLANIGSPAQSRIFSERKEARDFIFADAYDYHMLSPAKAEFYSTRVPYTHMLYHKTFGTDKSEEKLSGMMTFNFGKKLNVGAEFDYYYSRGYYNSNGSKLYNFRGFANYQTDRYNLYAYFYNQNYVNFENGGLTDDRYINDLDALADEGRRKIDTRDFPVKFTEVWNRVKGSQFFLNHRYNLGFMRAEEEDADEEFVPVASVIHTLQYSDNFRRLINRGNTTALDSLYGSPKGDYGYPINKYNLRDTAALNDVIKSSEIKNTVGLSLREGFQDWVKFGLTAFISFENRSFEYPAFKYSPDSSYVPERKKEFTAYVGGELTSRSTDFLSYYAYGELGIVGDDIGELRVNGHIQSRFKLFGKEASVKALGRIENTTPAFFQRNYYSRYFTWNNNFNKIQRYYVGGEVDLASTNTSVAAGVENVTNYVYFGHKGMPMQYSGSIQVVDFRLKQNFYYRALGWENEVGLQIGSKENILPLPKLNLYSNLYFHFKVAKVMTVQLGADVRFFSSYHAPYYEAMTQQFQLQNPENRVKIGGYPLINAYANLHLKQAKFFITGYNLGSQFIDTSYFSLAHYPLNPFVLKMGISVYFNN